MVQKYKVYFANRPVFFSQRVPGEAPVNKGFEVVYSKGKHDVMLIENALSKGASHVRVICEDVDASWKAFQEQFTFVQAAGGLVENDKGELLFIYRLDKWDLPKGKVEVGENLDEAALREVEEECSITNLDLNERLLSTWHTYVQDGTPMLKETVWYRMKYHGSITPRPQTIEGITDARWIHPENLKIVMDNTYASVMDVLEVFRKN
ncbi:MAG TPA: NUDIX domain-containing protein [Flavobacteriales bacterium]